MKVGDLSIDVGTLCGPRQQLSSRKRWPVVDDTTATTTLAAGDSRRAQSEGHGQPGRAPAPGNKKIAASTYKNKSRQKSTMGHRQSLTRLKVETIDLGARKRAARSPSKAKQEQQDKQEEEG